MLHQRFHWLNSRPQRKPEKVSQFKTYLCRSTFECFPTNKKTYVFNSAHVYSPLDLDEPIVTPVAAPRVLHQPVVDAIFSTIADNKDSVVLVGLKKRGRREGVSL